MINDDFTKLIEKWGKYVGLLSAIAGLISLASNNKIVAFFLLTIGFLLLEIWFWTVWHQGVYIQKAIKEGKPLPSPIYTDKQRKTGQVFIFLTPFAYVVPLFLMLSANFQPLFQNPTPTPTITPSFTPTFTSIPPTPTQTTILTATSTNTVVPTLTETRTPRPTFTFTPTFTPTLTPDPEIYRGFNVDCISADYWYPNVFQGEATPEQSQNTCFDLKSRGFNSQNGGLRINIQDSAYSVFAISTDLSGSELEIHFKVNFQSFTSNSSDTAAVLAFGVGPSDDWAMKDGYYLSYMIPEGSTTNEINEQTGTSRIEREHLLHRFYAPKEITVRMIIRGIDLTMYIEKDTYNFFPISIAGLGDEYHFWIGYQLPPGRSTLKATITEFSIIEIK